ncbi:hypothetical protein ACV330_29895, partial [Pseudomonas aeruginosa]
GDEVILSIGNGVRTVFDRTRTQRDATFSYNGTWGLFDVGGAHDRPGDVAYRVLALGGAGVGNDHQVGTGLDQDFRAGLAV